MNNFKKIKNNIYESYSLNEAESDRRAGQFVGKIKNGIQQKWNDFKDGYKSTQVNQQQKSNQQQNNQQQQSPIKSRSQLANDINTYLTLTRNYFDTLKEYQSQLQTQLNPNNINIDTSKNSQLVQRIEQYSKNAREITDTLIKQLHVINQRFVPCSQRLRQFGTDDETVKRDLPRFNLAIGIGKATLTKLVSNIGLIGSIHNDLKEYLNILLPDGRPKSFTADDFQRQSQTLNRLAHDISQNINIVHDYLVSLVDWGQFFDLLSDNKMYDRLMNNSEMMALVISAMADWDPKNSEDILNLNDAFNGVVARQQNFKNASNVDDHRDAETRGLQGLLNIVTASNGVKQASKAAVDFFNLLGSDSMTNLNRGQSAQSKSAQTQNANNKANVENTINQRNQQLQTNNSINNSNDGQNVTPRFSESFKNTKYRILEAISGRGESDLGTRLFRILGNDKNMVDFTKAAGPVALSNPDDPFTNYVLQNRYIWANGFCNSGNNQLDFELFKTIYNWRVTAANSFNELGPFFQNSRVFTNGYNQKLLRRIANLDAQSLASFIQEERRAYEANHTLDNFNAESFLQQHSNNDINYSGGNNRTQQARDTNLNFGFPSNWTNRNDYNNQMFNSMINLIQNGSQIQDKRYRRILQELNNTLNRLGYVQDMQNNNFRQGD